MVTGSGQTFLRECQVLYLLFQLASSNRYRDTIRVGIGGGYFFGNIQGLSSIMAFVS